MNGEVVDAVANMWAVKAFSARRRERDRLAHKVAVEAGTHTRSWMHIEKTRVLHDIGLWAIAAAMLTWAIQLWTTGAISPGEVVMVSAVTFRVLLGSRELALALIGIAQESAVVDEALSAIARPHEVPDHPGAKPFVPRGGTIEFENVTFSYGSGRGVFDGFSLSIQPGQKVGLVGTSGAGKSTLVSLVQRMEEVQSRTCSYRWATARGGDPGFLARRHRSGAAGGLAISPLVLENIRYGRPDATDNEVVAAAVAACADEFIMALPEGYQTILGERGAKLSGGQRQRLGIARAILEGCTDPDPGRGHLGTRLQVGAGGPAGAGDVAARPDGAGHRASALHPDRPRSHHRAVGGPHRRGRQPGRAAGAAGCSSRSGACRRTASSRPSGERHEPVSSGDARGRMKVVMVPSVSGGIGHISRTATLARALRRLAPDTGVDYVFDAERLRPFNIDAALGLGYRPRLLPPRTPESRGPIVRACFGDADVIVDDVVRYLVPLRRHVPRAAWISIAMHPLHDELFMEWPLLAQTDAIIWAYPPAMGLPAELEIVADKIVQTGPFLDLDDVPARPGARAKLGYGPDDPVVVYAPRGFPFGKEFGHKILGAIYGAIESLRRDRQPRLRLVLMAVSDPAELRDVEGMPAECCRPGSPCSGSRGPGRCHAAPAGCRHPGCRGHQHDPRGSRLGTPMVVVPGPIPEILLLAEAMHKREAAHVIKIKKIAGSVLEETFATILGNPDRRQAMTGRAAAMVAGGGGVDAAARLVLDVTARRRAEAG